MYREASALASTSRLDHSYTSPSTISAFQSLRMLKSVSSVVFSIIRPFSLAKCSRQIKQKLVDISSMTDVGYTFCRPFTTSVNLSVGFNSDGGGGSLLFSSGAEGGGTYNYNVSALRPRIMKTVVPTESSFARSMPFHISSFSLLMSTFLATRA